MRRTVYIGLLIHSLFILPQAQSYELKHNHAAESATAPLAALGKRLFFDTRLSGDGKVSCANCHQPDKAFTDNLPLAQGVYGRYGTRNTPSLLNAADAAPFFWDGRRPSLETQVLDPLLNSQEHGLIDEAHLLSIIRSDVSYNEAFAAAFPKAGSKIRTEHVRAALAAYLRTLRSAGSRFDRFLARGSQAVLNARERSGFELFIGRAGCAECHRIGRDAMFTDHRFHNRRIGMDRLTENLPELVTRIYALAPSERVRLIAKDAAVAALGRFVVTAQPADIGKFKTPSLRNAAATAPYMHDGSIATLEDAVRYESYYREASSDQTTNLTLQEQGDIVEFLKALTDARYDRTVDAARE